MAILSFKSYCKCFYFKMLLQFSYCSQNIPVSMIWDTAISLIIQLVTVIMSRHEEVLWRLFLARYLISNVHEENVKIITWSLCCWPQDLHWIINCKLTDTCTSNDLHSTVLGKESLLYKLHWVIECNMRACNETMSYSFIANSLCLS